jgi:shikimate kinase
MPGVGKTSVGTSLSNILGYPVVDSDRILVEREHRSIAAMFTEEGEPWFREREAELIAELVENDTPSVLSVGGGAVLNGKNRDILRAGATVVWLRASLETLVLRVGNGRGRPLIEGDVAGRLQQLMLDRSPVYEQASHFSVDVNDATAQVAAQRVSDLLLLHENTMLPENTMLTHHNDAELTHHLDAEAVQGITPLANNESTTTGLER